MSFRGITQLLHLWHTFLHHFYYARADDMIGVFKSWGERLNETTWDCNRIGDQIEK